MRENTARQALERAKNMGRRALAEAQKSKLIGKRILIELKRVRERDSRKKPRPADRARTVQTEHVLKLETPLVKLSEPKKPKKKLKIIESLKNLFRRG